MHTRIPKFPYCSRRQFLSEFGEKSSTEELRRTRPGFTTDDIEKLPSVDYSIAKVSKDEIKYVLFKDSKDDEGKYVTKDTIKHLKLDKKLPTKVLLHGWMSSGLMSPWYTLLRKGYFEISPHNIIFVDYTIPGTKTYEQSAANSKLVGEFIGQFLLSSQISHERTHLISHSLGSHVASFVGKQIFKSTGKRIARITALDPASRMFESKGMPDNLRLNKSDADFVDVIHTDIEFSGFALPLGHVDFYPNYGTHQPGCPERKGDDNCSHARSKSYFIESLSRRNTKAKEAKIIGSGKRIKMAVIEDGEEIIFGDSVPVTSRGVFYLKTNSNEPFLIDDR